jgi:hypothetical protein
MAEGAQTMPKLLRDPVDCMSVAIMRSERLRLRAELVEVIAGTKRTLARSRALLAEVDAILAREKSILSAPQVAFFDAC